MKQVIKTINFKPKLEMIISSCLQGPFQNLLKTRNRPELGKSGEFIWHEILQSGAFVQERIEHVCRFCSLR